MMQSRRGYQLMCDGHSLGRFYIHEVMREYDMRVATGERDMVIVKPDGEEIDAERLRLLIATVTFASQAPGKR